MRPIEPLGVLVFFCNFSNSEANCCKSFNLNSFITRVLHWIELNWTGWIQGGFILQWSTSPNLPHSSLIIQAVLLLANRFYFDPSCIIYFVPLLYMHTYASRNQGDSWIYLFWRSRSSSTWVPRLLRRMPTTGSMQCVTGVGFWALASLLGGLHSVSSASLFWLELCPALSSACSVWGFL